MGRTRDISTSGLYFLLDQPLRPGSRLDLSLTLPAALTGSGDVTIELVGRVLRVEPAKDGEAARIGVAARIENYDIIRTSSAA